MSVEPPALHRLLQRQLRQLGLQPGVAPDVERWGRLLERVSRAYAEADDERYLMERSESIASAEMASLNAALKSARDSAEALAAVKATFLANMSHEIRTPLNAVLGMAYLAMQADPSPRQRDYLGKIQQAGQHLLGIINDILDFSKIEAGRAEVERVPFELDQTLESVLSMVAERAAAKGLALALEVGAGVPSRLVGDPQKLRQILINYLNNAVKFTEAGQVTLRVSAGALEADGAQPLRFEVVDTGIGVAASETDRIFRSFEQADASTTRRYGGTGLGLAICRRLAELMGGEVGVESRPGAGSTFWLALALGRSAQAGGVTDGPASAGYRVDAVAGRLVGRATPAAVARPAAGARVLLVDDNALNQQVACELLRAMGVEVDVAADGREAVERMQRAPAPGYALVLMDVHMPVMDGIEATRALRAIPRFASVPIVAMTASVLPEERQRVLDAGMNALLPKPVDPAELQDSVATWLNAAGSAARARAAGATASPPTGLPVVDGLDATTGLHRCGGDPHFYLRMLAEFVDRWSGFGGQARAAVAAGDWARLARDAHTLKGLCGTLGASRLQDRALALERAVGSPPGPVPAAFPAETDAAIDALEADLHALVAGLRGRLPGPRDGSGAAAGPRVLEAADRDRALRIASEALALLEAGELAVIQRLEAEREFFGAWMPGDVFEALQRALRDYDLEGAAEVLGAAAVALSASSD